MTFSVSVAAKTFPARIKAITTRDKVRPRVGEDWLVRLEGIPLTRNSDGVRKRRGERRRHTRRWDIEAPRVATKPNRGPVEPWGAGGDYLAIRERQPKRLKRPQERANIECSRPPPRWSNGCGR